jgi:predicted small lipoprotein YifL
MLRQKRFFIASVALTLLISGCGLKGPLYKKDQAINENIHANHLVAEKMVNKRSTKQE